MADQDTLPAPTNNTPVRQFIQPIASPPGDMQPSPTNIGPLSIHSSSRTPSEAAPGDLGQPVPPLVAQRHAVQSLQVIPQPARFMFLDRGSSVQQISNSRQPMRIGVMGQRQPSQNSLVAFRQESLRGSRVVHVSSTQEIPEVNRPLNTPTIQPNANRAVIIPIDHIEEEEQRNEAAENNRQGEQEAEEGQVESELQVQDPNERRVARVALLRVCLQFIFNITLMLIYGFAYMYVEDIIGVTGVMAIAISFIVVYLIGLGFKKKYSSREFDKMDYLLALGNGISLIIFIVMAYIKYEGSDIPLTPFSLFGILVLFGSCCKSSLEPPQPSTVIILIIKVIVWVQIFLIALQIDSLNIPWSTVFIPLYFGLLLLAFSSILIIFGSTYAFINIMKSEGVSAKLILGSIWYILNALYTGAWLAILTQVARQLDSNEGSIQTGLAIALIHGGVLFFYTLIFWKTLCKFQEFEVQSEMLVQPTAESTEALNQAETQRTQVRFQVSKDDKTHLVMISPSFYTYLKKHLKHKNDKDIQQLKKELEKTKLERANNALALRAPHYTDIPNTNPPAEASPKVIALRNREFSEGAMQMRQHQISVPVPVPMEVEEQAKAPASIPTMKRGESTRSGENLCTICYDNIPNAVFMDCGHGGVCYECAVETWKKSDYCILCRQKINKVLKIVTLKPLNITKVVECTRKIVENV